MPAWDGRAAQSHMMLVIPLRHFRGGLVYFFCGFAWQGYTGGPGHELLCGRKGWNWIAPGPFFLRKIDLDGSPASLAAIFGMFSCRISGIDSAWDRAPTGGAWVRFALPPRILAGLTFPLFAHWVWGGGWLAQLGD